MLPFLRKECRFIFLAVLFLAGCKTSSSSEVLQLEAATADEEDSTQLFLCNATTAGLWDTKGKKIEVAIGLNQAVMIVPGQPERVGSFDHELGGSGTGFTLYNGFNDNPDCGYDLRVANELRSGAAQTGVVKVRCGQSSRNYVCTTATDTVPASPSSQASETEAQYSCLASSGGLWSTKGKKIGASITPDQVVLMVTDEPVRTGSFDHQLGGSGAGFSLYNRFNDNPDCGYDVRVEDDLRSGASPEGELKVRCGQASRNYVCSKVNVPE